MNGRIPFLVFILMSFVLIPARAFGYRNVGVTARSFLAIVTAYSSSPRAVTASGSHAFDGAAACPRKYPFGTRFMIEGKIEGKKFVCKRCKREYAYPQVNGRPIRCECGWWYFNDRGNIREEFNQRIDPFSQSFSSR